MVSTLGHMRAMAADSVPFDPVPPSQDPAVARFTDLRWAGLHRFAQLLRDRVDDADAECMTSALRALDHLGDSWPTIALHPYYTQWWARFSRAIQAGQKPAVSELIPHLSRFLVVPLARIGGLEATRLTLPAALAGQVRFPGHHRHLVLPARHGRQRLSATVSDGYLEIGSGPAERIAVADLLDEHAVGTTGPLVTRPWIPGLRVEVDSSDPWIVDYLLQESLTKPSPGRSRDDVEPLTITDGELRRLADTLAALASAWPEMHREVIGYVRLVVPFSSQIRAAFSNVAWHGAVFLRPTFGDEVANVERLVHETSHLRLNLVMSHTKLHEHAPDDVLPSPFRAGPRPVTGLYHGAFVVTRAAVALDRVYQRGGEAGYAERIPILLAQVTAALVTLRRHARLTSAGRDLLDEVAENVDALADVYGLADAAEPRVYQEL